MPLWQAESSSSAHTHAQFLALLSKKKHPITQNALVERQFPKMECYFIENSRLIWTSERQPADQHSRPWGSVAVRGSQVAERAETGREASIRGRRRRGGIEI